MRQRIVTHVTHRRQCDLPGPLQHQQQAATDHVAQRAIGLPPLPRLAQPGRKPAPALLRMPRNQRAYIKDVFLADLAAAISVLCHCQQYAASIFGTQGLRACAAESLRLLLRCVHATPHRRRSHARDIARRHQQLGLVGFQRLGRSGAFRPPNETPLG